MITKEQLDKVVGKFYSCSDKSFFIETSIGNFIWNRSESFNYINPIRNIDVWLSDNKVLVAQERGEHTIGEYCQGYILRECPECAGHQCRAASSGNALAYVPCKKCGNSEDQFIWTNRLNNRTEVYRVPEDCRNLSIKEKLDLVHAGLWAENLVKSGKEYVNRASGVSEKGLQHYRMYEERFGKKNV